MQDRAGTVVQLVDWTIHPQFEGFAGGLVRIEDTWENVTGSSWVFAAGNPAAIIYAMRTGLMERDIPTDDEVWYGKFSPMPEGDEEPKFAFGVLIHESEIDGEWSLKEAV